jgi:hypothetical protein
MFRLVKIQNAKMNVPEPEYLAATVGEAFEEGEALVIVAGKLTKATGSTKPEFISAKTVTAAEGEILPVSRLESNQVWETEKPEGATVGGTLENGATITAVYDKTVHVMFR